MDPALILGLLSMAVRSCASPVQNSPAVDGGQAGIKRQFAEQLLGLRDVTAMDKILETNSWRGGHARLPLREGDIAQLPGTGPRSAIACPGNSCLWPKAVDGFVYVPYRLSPEYVDMDRITIELGILDISSRTCVKFVPRTHEDDFLDIQPHSGCWSYLGRTGGAQTLSLQSPGCMWSGVVSHELMHALGFVHEQSRSDRNRYVTIKWENIVEGQEHNFKKYETNNLKTPYDYGSIMHYGRYAFSEDGDPTIVPKPDPRTPIGQRDGPSATDLHKINLLYNCGEQRLSSVSSFSGHSAQWSTIALDTQPLSTLIW
ncbi:high choriolytic enzyme 1-like isoform X2 [Scleropages formosus]|uniref:Metalloendopeptidase n=1 Tax=Scleropages formosus TaxID=113540 RepID=A0A8C9RUR9_SCLFO|nr:high choriolytic enzyme 1-like isoform X2 [Scleropages formosus]